MGQSASRHGGGGNNENDDNANATAKIIKNSLFELSVEELKLLLDYCCNNENNSKRIDAAELRSVARSLQQAKTDNNKNTEASSSSEETSDSGASRGCGTIYYDDQIETPETRLAITLNSLSGHVAKLRFQLVPSRLKESLFWEALFEILKERLVKYNDEMVLLQNRQQLPRIEEEEEEEEESQTRTPPVTTKQTNKISGGDNNNNEWLRSQLALRNSRIAKLQQHVKQLQRELNSAKKTSNNPKAATTIHQGKWIMDQNSKEFLEYPKELKENLRREKQRRLEQVNKEMGFILDSDELKDTNGRWDCCGANKYDCQECVPITLPLQYVQKNLGTH